MKAIYRSSYDVVCKVCDEKLVCTSRQRETNEVYDDEFEATFTYEGPITEDFEVLEVLMYTDRFNLNLSFNGILNSFFTELIVLDSCSRKGRNQKKFQNIWDTLASIVITEDCMDYGIVSSEYLIRLDHGKEDLGWWSEKADELAGLVEENRELEDKYNQLNDDSQLGRQELNEQLDKLSVELYRFDLDLQGKMRDMKKVRFFKNWRPRRKVQHCESE